MFVQFHFKMYGEFKITFSSIFARTLISSVIQTSRSRNFFDFGPSFIISERSFSSVTHFPSNLQKGKIITKLTVVQKTKQLSLMFLLLEENQVKFKNGNKCSRCSHIDLFLQFTWVSFSRSDIVGVY